MNYEDRLEAARENLNRAKAERISEIRQQLPSGASATHCMTCGEAIPQARREALPGVQLCVICQSKRERHG